jgi:hypothetical protein
MPFGNMSTDIRQALTTNAQIVAGYGTFLGFDWFNASAATAWVFVYDTATTPTVGSTTGLIYQKGLPAGAGSNEVFPAGGRAFQLGLWIGVSSSATTSGTPGTGLTLTTMFS